MNQIFTKQKASLFISFILMLFIACERDATKSVFVENPEVRPDPIITSIEPADGSLSGIGQMTINGSNFSTTTKNNVVFFGSTIATIVSATESELIVKTPRIVGDSIEVKVSVIGAQLFSNVIYYNKIVEATREVGGYGNLSEDLYAIAADANDNLYVAVQQGSQLRLDIISSDSIGKSQVYQSPVPIVTRGMKMGPGGYLYLVKGSEFNKILYRVPPGGGFQQPYVLLPHSVYDLDFDPAGNIYIAGGDTSMSNLFLVYPDKSYDSVAVYTDVLVRAVRYFDGYVYIAGVTRDSVAAVWRNEIMSAPNDLGPNEMVIDVTAELGQGIEAYSLTFAQDGDMYVGTTAVPNPILVVHPDGSNEPLYPGILAPQIFDMVWGNDNFLYVTRRASVRAGTEPRALRIDMQKLGAPYYGRQL